MTLTEALTANLMAQTACGVTFPPSYEYRGFPRERIPTLGLFKHGFGTWTWIRFDSPVAERAGSFQVTILIIPGEKEEYAPRTALGEKLVSLRKKAVAAGMRLLSEDELLEEVRRRRGELENHEADVY